MVSWHSGQWIPLFGPPRPWQQRQMSWGHTKQHTHSVAVCWSSSSGFPRTLLLPLCSSVVSSILHAKWYESCEMGCWQVMPLSQKVSLFVYVFVYALLFWGWFILAGHATMSDTQAFVISSGILGHFITFLLTSQFFTTLTGFFAWSSFSVSLPRCLVRISTLFYHVAILDPKS